MAWQYRTAGVIEAGEAQRCYIRDTLGHDATSCAARMLLLVWTCLFMLTCSLKLARPRYVPSIHIIILM